MNPLKIHKLKLNKDVPNLPTRLRYTLLFLGWAIFITSFFLPAYTGLMEPAPGWGAAYVSLVSIKIDFEYPDPEKIYWFSFTPCNILMLLSPFIVFRAKKKKYLHWYLISMVAATLLVSSWGVRSIRQIGGGEVLIGYYLWFLSFLLVTISLFIKRPQNVVKHN